MGEYRDFVFTSGCVVTNGCNEQVQANMYATLKTRPITFSYTTKLFLECYVENGKC